MQKYGRLEFNENSGQNLFFFRIEIFVFHEAAAKNLAAVSEFVRTLIV